MAARRDTEHLRGLLRELRRSHEAEWVEFKVNNKKPALIGEYISAMANSAALVGKAHGYVVWGVEDETRALVGTRFSPGTAKRGNEPLETWLARLLAPQVHFRFHESVLDDKPFVVLEVDRATHRPIAFQGTEFMRVGSAKRKLRDFPEKERALWRTFSQVRFEDGVAAEHLAAEDVLRMLNCPAYFDLLGQPPADGRDATLDALEHDKLIARSDAGGFDVTNPGAMLLARDLGDFPRLRRKALRVIEYRGTGRLETLHEHEGVKGYAASFADLLDHINTRLPHQRLAAQALPHQGGDDSLGDKHRLALHPRSRGGGRRQAGGRAGRAATDALHALLGRGSADANLRGGGSASQPIE